MLFLSFCHSRKRVCMSCFECVICVPSGSQVNQFKYSRNILLLSITSCLVFCGLLICSVLYKMPKGGIYQEDARLTKWQIKGT